MIPRTRYYTTTTTDPYSDWKRFVTLSAAKKFAEKVGHFHVFEYEVTPCIPGIEPERERLAANHYVENDVWIRDPSGCDDDE